MKPTQASPDTRSKKAIVLNKQRRKNPLIFVIIAAAAIVAITGVYYSLHISPANKPASAAAVGAQSDPNRITYPLSLFADGQARHFEHQTAKGLAIRYFILKSTDGVVRAAFDACDVCWPENKGYVQDGAAMVCNNCGRRFDSVLINEVQGGCNPAPLKRTISNDRLELLVQDIEEGQRYFNFEALDAKKGKG